MIEVKNIEKKFGKLEVLRGVSFKVNAGKITAIVGPNGSGKTTIIKTILGLVRPDSGEILFSEKNIVGQHLYRKHIGYMPQAASFPDNLSVRELIKMISNLRNEVELKASPYIDVFNLAPELNKSLRNLSGGNKQKVSAMIALMFNPSILILDEPTAGLDPVASSRLKEILQIEKEKGKTIILTSHIMAEVQELADDIMFLLDGRIQFNGSLRSLLTNKGETKLEKAIAAMMKDVKVWN